MDQWTKLWGVSGRGACPQAAPALPIQLKLLGYLVSAGMAYFPPSACRDIASRMPIHCHLPSNSILTSSSG